MKKLSKLKLQSLKKDSLNDYQMSLIKGGQCCICFGPYGTFGCGSFDDCDDPGTGCPDGYNFICVP